MQYHLQFYDDHTVIIWRSHHYLLIIIWWSSGDYLMMIYSLSYFNFANISWSSVYYDNYPKIFWLLSVYNLIIFERKDSADLWWYSVDKLKNIYWKCWFSEDNVTIISIISDICMLNICWSSVYYLMINWHLSDDHILVVW